MTESSSMIVRRDTGVIFDMDGVLVDSAQAHLESWEMLAGECGTTVSEQQCAAMFGRHNNDIIPRLFGDVSSARLGALALRKESIYRELIRVSPPLVEGATSLIEGLYQAGVRLAVGSSGPPPNIELVLDALGVRDKFDIIVSGADVSRGKPDPQVFELACRGLNLPPDQCIVVEDAPVGVEAARSAGTKTVAVLMYHEADAFDGPDKVVRTLVDLDVPGLVGLVG